MKENKISFGTTRFIHLPKNTSVKFKKKDLKIPVKFYTQRDYDLFVLKKRPGIILEYLSWSVDKKVFFATCLIISEEGGIFWDKDFKPNFEKIEKLIESNKLIAMKYESFDYNDKIIFICSPPTDHVYDKILEEKSINWVAHVNYGKYNLKKNDKKSNALIVLFILFITFSYAVIIALYTYVYF